jgi:biopolymer transport protein ExbB/TolQ
MTANIRHALVWTALGIAAAILAIFSMIGVNLPG